MGDQSLDRLRRLRKGEMVFSPVGQNPHGVPNGLIHHWIGAVFVLGARLVTSSLSCAITANTKISTPPTSLNPGSSARPLQKTPFSLRLLNKAVVATFALDTQFQSTFKQIDENKWYSISYTTRVREVENYGLPINTKRRQTQVAGLIWRLYSISRFKQRDGGVYVELEAVALSRDAPGALRWLIDPLVRRTSRSSMQVSLQKTEEAVLETRLTARSNENYGVPAKSALLEQLTRTRVQNGSTP